MAIYDCFTFYNELDLLKIRMDLLDPYVDYFVLVESTRTHRGESKELFFYNNRDDFEKYKDKIIYVCPEDSSVPTYKGDGDWSLENYQRNCILHGLKNCSPEDIIIISDLDEIPNLPSLLDPGKTISVRSTLSKEFSRRKKLLYAGNYGIRETIKAVRGNVRLKDLLETSPVACEQDLYYYFLNCKSEGKWYGSIITKFKNISMPQYMRDRRNLYPCAENGGWHFSYVGGLDRVKSKLKSIIDSGSDIIEKMKKYENDDQYILFCMENGIDLYGREEKESKYHFVDPSEIGVESYRKLLKDYPTFFHISSQ